MNNHHMINRQVSPVSALMPIFGTASAFVSLVGLGIVLGATAMGMM